MGTMGTCLSPTGGTSWGQFTGSDDVCFPVSMFVHIIEFKMKQEGLTDDKAQWMTLEFGALSKDIKFLVYTTASVVT